MALLNQRDRLLEALKKHAPSKVRAFCGDDDTVDIAVPTRRKKWGQVIAAIESRSWTRVEMMNRSGELLGSVENTAPAGDLESLDPSPTGGELRLAERIVAMVLKGQRETMAFRDAEVQNLLRAQGDVLREMSNGMRALSSLYQEQVSASRDIARMQVDAAQQAAQGDDSLKQLLDAAPAIMQALPLLRSLLNPGVTDAAPPPPNGARKP